MKAHVMMMTVAALAGMTIFNSTTKAGVIEDFENVTDWTVGGGPGGDRVNSSITTDSSDKKVGQSSGKFVYAHSGSGSFDYLDLYKHFDPSLDASNKVIKFWFKSQPESHDETLSLHVVSTNGGYFFRAFTDSERDGAWHYLELPINLATFSSHDAPDISSISYVRFRSANHELTAFQNTFDVDRMELTSVPEPGSLCLLGLGGLTILSRKQRRRQFATKNSQ